MEVFELIGRIQRGEDARDAQEKLYHLVRNEILHLIRQRIPHRLKPRLDAEDVLDEAFLRSIKSLDRFKPSFEKSFYAWVYTISKNIIRDQSVRRSAAAFHFTRGEEEGGPRESKIIDELSGPATQILRHDLVESYLDKLRDREAEVIRLHRLEGKSFHEIALFWNKTPGSVQRFFSRSWSRFLKIVKEEMR